MAYIKRGEAKVIPVRVKFNDMDVFPLGNVDEIAFKLGDSVRKTWPDAVRYDNANDRFLLTLTQEDTLSLDAGQAELAVQDLLYDPQTAGGLLIACDPEDADALFTALKPAVPSAQRVGTVQPYAGSARIYLK